MTTRVLFEDKSAAGTSGLFDTSEHTMAVVYIVFSGNVTGGTVVVETAHKADWSGTWATLASIAASANKVEVVNLNGCFKYIRARIATAITGGTASCYGFASR